MVFIFLKKFSLSTVIFLTLLFSAKAQQVSDSLLTDSEKMLILSRGQSEVIRVLQITNPVDSAFLRKKALPVKADPADTILQRFILRMYSTVRDSASMGVGIAAPQVGLSRQIVYVQRFDLEGEPFGCYLNAKIVEYSPEMQVGPEGCLSIPNKRADVKRAECITIEYDLPDGSHHSERVKGFTAVIFQHEIDHLNGIVFTDHLEKEVQKGKSHGKD